MSRERVVIYQLVVRYFGNTNTTNAEDGTILQNGCGKFADINDASIKGLCDLGITHVWLTGILRQATLTDYGALGMPADDPDAVKGRAGSFYAVRDYFDVCPDYAVDPAKRLIEFIELLARLHGAGLKVLIDLVPNHVARSYHSVVRPMLDFGRDDDTTKFFARDNSFFYLTEPPGQHLTIERAPHWNPTGVKFTGGVATEDGSPGHPPKATGDNLADPHVGHTRWYETVKLNYGFNFMNGNAEYEPRPRTWTRMNEIIAHWQTMGVDGFRCDFAHFVPPEFWSFAIAEARKRDPRAIFIAEAYPWEGSGDPVTKMSQLTHAGFDAIYYDAAYNSLKRIYVGGGSQEDYDRTVRDTPVPPAKLLQYLENHDERRIASKLVFGGDAHNSGFGNAEAAYQIAPLHYLQSAGPILIYNGQETGEIGDGKKGFNQDEGRTTVFDYWCMPQHAKWVNRHRYDGGALEQEQAKLREFYKAVVKLSQHPAALGSGYWGLKYFNQPGRFADCPGDFYTFARFEPGRGKLLLVIANFRGGAACKGTLRIPPELAQAAGLKPRVNVKLIFNRNGNCSGLVRTSSLDDFFAKGLEAEIPVQSTHVFEIASGR